MHLLIGLFMIGAVSCYPQRDLAVVLEASEDGVVVEADRQGRFLVDSITPVDDSSPEVASFRLPLNGVRDEDLGAVIVEAAEGGSNQGRDGLQDIPRDRSAPNQAGFRLPLPEEAEFVVIEAGEDIPTDTSDTGVAGFRLPLAAAEDDATSIQFEDPAIPLDTSGPGRAGFRLPLPEDDVHAVVIEADRSEAGRSASDIPRDHSGLVKAGVRLPLPDDVDDDSFAAVVVESLPAGRDGLDNEEVDLIPRDESGLAAANFRLPLPEEAGRRSRVLAGVPRREEAEILLVGDEPGDVEVLTGRGRALDPAVCFEAVKDKGVCRGSIPSFSYDPASDTCQEFVYSGCAGSANRFATLQECTDLCKGQKLF